MAAAHGASASDIVMFEHDDFQGRQLQASGSLGDFHPRGFNDIVSSVIVRRGHWELCTHARFDGPCIVLGPGRYPSLDPMHFNDRVSSLRPAAGHGGDRGHGDRNGDLVLFRHADFQGRSIGLDSREPDLNRFGLNDEVSSVVVRRGVWQLCSDAGYSGTCIELSPGSYPTLRPYGLNDTLSSARRVSGRHREAHRAPLPAPGWGREAGPTPATPACTQALSVTIANERGRVDRVELFDGEVEEFRVSDDEVGVRGAGQYHTARAVRPFRFECSYDLRSGQVSSMRLRD
ncbi:beta/gamma crystallin-related protein [Caldimonas brevitalea]|nr:beta/gamma crystallin-related protein [Caldimonas brevitalea]